MYFPKGIWETERKTNKKILFCPNLCIHNIYQYSPRHTQGMLVPLPSLTWKWGRAKSFDVAAGSTQDIPSQYALSLAWGEHNLHT